MDAVLARRQPGSTLKPFVYGLAFERRLITPASLLDDSPAQLATASGVYAPQNYDRDFKGWVSARTALGASLNVPAVRVAAMLPPDAAVQPPSATSASSWPRAAVTTAMRWRWARPTSRCWR